MYIISRGSYIDLSRRFRWHRTFQFSTPTCHSICLYLSPDSQNLWAVFLTFPSDILFLRHSLILGRMFFALFSHWPVLFKKSSDLFYLFWVRGPDSSTNLLNDMRFDTLYRCVHSSLQDSVSVRQWLRWSVQQAFVRANRN